MNSTDSVAPNDCIRDVNNFCPTAATSVEKEMEVILVQCSQVGEKDM